VIPRHDRAHASAIQRAISNILQGRLLNLGLNGRILTLTEPGSP
jgi:hypothetical protein